MFEVSVSFSRGDYVLINKLKPVGRIVERLKFPLRDYARLLARYYSLFVAFAKKKKKKEKVSSRYFAGCACNFEDSREINLRESISIHDANGLFDIG